MLFQLVLTKSFKSELFSCLPKVDYVINSCKGSKAPAHLFQHEGAKLDPKRNLFYPLNGPIFRSLTDLSFTETLSFLPSAVSLRYCRAYVHWPTSPPRMSLTCACFYYSSSPVFSTFLQNLHEKSLNFPERVLDSYGSSCVFGLTK